MQADKWIKVGFHAYGWIRELDHGHYQYADGKGQGVCCISNAWTWEINFPVLSLLCNVIVGMLARFQWSCWENAMPDFGFLRHIKYTRWSTRGLGYVLLCNYSANFYIPRFSMSRRTQWTFLSTVDNSKTIIARFFSLNVNSWVTSNMFWLGLLVILLPSEC